MLPAMPSASTIACGSSPSAAPTPAAAAMAPNIAVGWKPALCTRLRRTTAAAGTWSRRRPRCRAARGAVGLVTLAGRQHRRHDHRAGMHRAALEGVVEILAVGGGAVDESGAGRAQRAGMADRRAGPVIVAAGERALDIVLVARGDAKPDDVDQQILAFRPHRGAAAARHRARRCARRAARQRRRFGKAWRSCQLEHAPRDGAVATEAAECDLTERDDGEGEISMIRPSTAMAPRSPLSLRSKISTEITLVCEVNSMIAADSSRITPTKMKHQVAITLVRSSGAVMLPRACAAASRRGCGWRLRDRDGRTRNADCSC